MVKASTARAVAVLVADERLEPEGFYRVNLADVNLGAEERHPPATRLTWTPPIGPARRHLPPLPRKIVSHAVLTGGVARVRQTAAGIEVSVPPAQHDPLDTIIKLALDGPAGTIPATAPASGEELEPSEPPSAHISPKTPTNAERKSP